MPPYDTLHVRVGTREAIKTSSDVARKKFARARFRYEYASIRYGVLRDRGTR